MFGSAFWLCASVCATGLVQGRTVQIPFEDLRETNTGGTNTPLTITVGGEAAVSHPPDIAMLHVSIRTSGLSKDAARHEMIFAVDGMESLLHQFSGEPSSAIEDWTIGRPNVRSNDPRVDPSVGYMLQEDATSLDNAPEEFKATVQLNIRFQKLDFLEIFADRMTSLSQARIDRIRWYLDEQNSAAAKAELRKKAIDRVLQAGHDYADAFGSKSAQPLEFEEQYISGMMSDFDYGSLYDDMFFDHNREVSLEPVDVSMSTNVKCKFSVV